MGEQVVGEKHRLSPLEVGVAGQVGVARLLGPAKQHLLQGDDLADQAPELTLRIEPEVGDHLVVAASTGVQLGARIPGDLGDPALHRGVDVLVGGLEHERPRGQLVLHLVERGQ